MPSRPPYSQTSSVPALLEQHEQQRLQLKLSLETLPAEILQQILLDTLVSAFDDCTNDLAHVHYSYDIELQPTLVQKALKLGLNRLHFLGLARWAGGETPLRDQYRSNIDHLHATSMRLTQINQRFHDAMHPATRRFCDYLILAHNGYEEEHATNLEVIRIWEREFNQTNEIKVLARLSEDIFNVRSHASLNKQLAEFCTALSNGVMSLAFLWWDDWSFRV